MGKSASDDQRKGNDHIDNSSAGQRPARGADAYRRTMDNSRLAEKIDDIKPKEALIKKVDRTGMAGEGLLKKGRDGGTKPSGNDGQPKASKIKRAAQFMVLIGSDEASKILSRLDSDQVEAISKEIVKLKKISSEEAEEVLEEFRFLLSPVYGYTGSSSGGVEEARRLLYAAFGPERGEEMLVKAVPDAAENPFDFLGDFSGEQLALLFRDESPAACAMVFSRLPSKLTAAALANTSPERKLDIVKRIARLKESSPEVIERVAAALREKARHFGRDNSGTEEIDGKNVLAEILKHSNISFGGRLLEELEEEDPSLSQEMKARLYTLDDVCGAADRPLQEKLRIMEDREIALLLRDRSEAFINKIMKNISQIRAERVREESVIMGTVPKIESEAAARDFLSWFRLCREEGRIPMLSDEDVLI